MKYDIEGVNDSLGTLTWDRKADDWQFKSEDSEVTRVFTEVRHRGTVPYRVSFSTACDIVDGWVDVGPSSEKFIEALSDLLMQETSNVMRLRRVESAS